jgi:hypothetical protein
MVAVAQDQPRLKVVRVAALLAVLAETASCL